MPWCLVRVLEQASRLYLGRVLLEVSYVVKGRGKAAGPDTVLFSLTEQNAEILFGLAVSKWRGSGCTFFASWI